MKIKIKKQNMFICYLSYIKRVFYYEFVPLKDSVDGKSYFQVLEGLRQSILRKEETLG